VLILVNGLYPYNSGKTTVGRALAAEMASRGMEPRIFKAQSAHNFWDHLPHSLRCEALGKLVSRDALLLAEAAGDPSPPELANPHHQLLSPIDPFKALEEAPGGGPLPAADELLMERTTDGTTAASTLFLNREASRFNVPEGFVQAMKKGVARVEAFAPLAVEKRAATARRALETCYARLKGSGSHFLVESTNDVIIPPGVPVEDVDLVVTAAANALLAYETGEFFRATKVTRSQRVRDFAGYAEPVLGYRLPFLTEEELATTEKLASRLGPAASGVLDRAMRGGPS
jgi:predicted P-loop ATPase/GTPase